MVNICYDVQVHDTFYDIMTVVQSQSTFSLDFGIHQVKTNKCTLITIIRNIKKLNFVRFISLLYADKIMIKFHLLQPQIYCDLYSFCSFSYL